MKAKDFKNGFCKIKYVKHGAGFCKVEFYYSHSSKRYRVVSEGGNWLLITENLSEAKRYYKLIK